MRKAGQVVLFRFPQTDLKRGKLRPALLLGRLPGAHNDWLLAMISSQLHHFVEDFDEILAEEDPDFEISGLKSPSLIRVGRLAVVEGSALRGMVGEISKERLGRVKQHLIGWLSQPQ